MVEKHLWQSEILSQDVGHGLVVCKYFASKNQLPGFYISGTSVENGLIQAKTEVYLWMELFN